MEALALDPAPLVSRPDFSYPGTIVDGLATCCLIGLAVIYTLLLYKKPVYKQPITRQPKFNKLLELLFSL